jgi:glycosyltransferase involved in cell wall biosynthesis
MACGCAVVDVDMPNVSSMVAPGENCLLARPDPEALSSALVRLVDDADLRLSLGRRGAEDMRVRSWEHTTSQFEAALQRLCFARLSA